MHTKSAQADCVPKLLYQKLYMQKSIRLACFLQLIDTTVVVIVWTRISTNCIYATPTKWIGFRTQRRAEKYHRLSSWPSSKLTYMPPSDQCLEAAFKTASNEGICDSGRISSHLHPYHETKQRREENVRSNTLIETGKYVKRGISCIIYILLSRSNSTAADRSIDTSTLVLSFACKPTAIKFFCYYFRNPLLFLQVLAPPPINLITDKGS